MIVSILQLMGFSVGKPVNSRASENPQSKPSKARIGGITAETSERAERTKQTSANEVHAQANSARRQEVKAQPGKAKAASKVTKAVVKAQPAAKAAAKPKAKPAAKAPPPAKKAVPKAAPKVAAKAKPAAKAAAKPKAKPVAKAPPPAKTVAKVVKTAPAKTVKASPAAKAAKPVAKVQSKDAVKTTIEKTAKLAVPVPKPKAAPSAAPGKVATPVASVNVATPPAPVAAPASSVPARAGRPSSRLAQLTVPSMAQSVASTAAKASYTQTMSSPTIVPLIAAAIKKDPKLVNNWKIKPVEQLTDADLIAMPDEEYMNSTQMAYFRLKLSLLKQDILSNAGETTEHLREETVVVPDPADRATIEEEHALELRTRDRERKLLKKIEQSIVRIDAGDYGYCDETGEPIGVGRLLARPTATLSLEAQQRRELKQKMFGD